MEMAVQGMVMLEFMQESLITLTGSMPMLQMDGVEQAQQHQLQPQQQQQLLLLLEHQLQQHSLHNLVHLVT